MLNKSKVFIFVLIAASIFTSCVDTRQTTYFNDINDAVVIPSDSDKVSSVIQKNDILSITITSLSQEASSPFNISANASFGNTITNAGTAQSAAGYLVNSDGFIQMPVLGSVKVAGLTTNEVKNLILNLVNERKMLKDPVVIVRHLNYEITVIGEVSKPAVISVPSEKISLLKALGLAGDITIYGKKDNVLLIREVNGKRTVKRINLNSPDFLTSSYYYLQPNDVVYVEANKNKVSSVSSFRQTVPIVLSSLSVLLVIANIIRRN